MNRNTADFHKVILYTATLLNSFINSNRFWWSLVFNVKDHVICKSFCFLLPIWLLFGFLSCLYAWLNLSVLCWLKVVRVDILVLSWVYKKSVYLFTVVCAVSSKLIIYVLYYHEVCSLCSYSKIFFIIKGYWILSKVFFFFLYLVRLYDYFPTFC